MPAWPCCRFVGPENGLLEWKFQFHPALPAVSPRPQILSRLLKCPPEQFERIMQGAGAGFLRPENGSSQDLADGVDSVRRLPRQVRSGPHPADECSTPFGPGPKETGAGAYQFGAVNDEALDSGGFEWDELLGDGGQQTTVLEDWAEEELVIGHGNPRVELLLVPGFWIPGQFPASRPYSRVRDIRLAEQVQRLPELPLGRFGRHGPQAELAGHECGGGVVEAYIGSGVVGDGAPYGLDGAVEG